MPPIPTAPLNWPLQVYDERYALTWYTQPAVFVNQALSKHGTADAVHWLHDRIDSVIETQRDDIRQNGGLLIIHDWRALQSYEPAARKAFMARMKQRKAGYLRGAIVVVPRGSSSLMSMAVQMGNLFTTVFMKAPVELRYDLAEVLAQRGVHAPV